MTAVRWPLLLLCALFQLNEASRLRAPPRRLKTGVAELHSMSMTALYPFYHTSDEIRTELKLLADRCPGMTFKTESRGSLLGGGAAYVDVVTIRSKSAKPTNKNFILMGEHARELIGPETGLYLIKSLCGETDLAEKSKIVLRDSEFQIVVNGNPRSRKRVEQGDFCLRVNENGVDLNRNWDDNWDPHPNPMAPADTNPGYAPFSEPETQIFKQLVSAYNPTTFLTIHAGTYGMYMPYAFNMHDLAKRNQANMLALLASLDKKHCECPYGAAGKEVGYACPGTCLDWIYNKLKTPYAFAFEIYTSPQYAQGLRSRWQEKQRHNMTALYQSSSHLGHEHFRDIFAENPSCFIQRSENNEFYHRLDDAQGITDCMGRFNPTTQESFDLTVHNWVDAYLDLAQMVVADLKSGKVVNGEANGARGNNTSPHVNGSNNRIPVQ